MSSASLTGWLQAAGGVGAAITAIVLALLAYQQMRASRAQASAVSEQVRLMRADAEEQRRHRDSEDLRREHEQADRDRAVRGQIAALAGITEATRDASRAQLQPIMFAHERGGTICGPHDGLDLGEGEIMFPYYLSNEGTGPALNIEHGVEVGGMDYPFAGGMQFRTARAGEFLPSLDEATSQPVPERCLRVVVPENELPAGWGTVVRTYWTRYENVFGEKFETRNSNNPRESAAFMRVTPLDPPPEVA